MIVSIAATASRAPRLTARLLDLNTRLQRMDRMFETTTVYQTQGVVLANDVRRAALELTAARDSFLNMTTGAAAKQIATDISTNVVNLAELAGHLASMPGGSYYVAGQCGSNLDGAIAATRAAAALLATQR